ncbi:MAG: 50S ribosomal protein L24 [Candidatus Omnitrophota bacterium]|jgi:large subunit ribosomal protein L24|nr:MAG: 50S ribosomal protein L24 [Candidatus Omnitrophota bacterium]
MSKIKKNDTVQAIKGKDRGKKGKVLKVIGESRIIVEGINLVKKSMRKKQQDQQGGIVSIEAPLAIANVILLCKNCNKPTRIGIKVAKDGSKARVCKQCKGTL